MSKLPLLEARTTVSGRVDTSIVGVFQDSGKKAIPPKGEFGNFVEKLRKSEVFDAKLGTCQLIRYPGKDPQVLESVLFVGLGDPTELSDEKIRMAGGHVWTKLSAEKIKSASVVVGKTEGSVRFVRTFAEGLILGAYRFDKYKSHKEGDGKHSGTRQIVFLAPDKNWASQWEGELQKVRAIGESVSITRDWSNEPSNEGTPVFFANESRRLARQYGLKCQILTENDAAKEKMGLFLGVGRGAERESRFVIVEYSPKKVKSPKTIVLVGKGVTFDSGGISIKPALRMEEMKHDMTGAATVMGATILASLWKSPNRVIAVMPFTENMPSGDAIQPGNILTARSGKTVEIINTDAEGRLILADALDYAQDFKPDAVIDVATLTGAVSIALGKHCCAVLGNDEAIVDSLRRVGDENGERIWQLPLFNEYFDDLKSDTADMKNSANDSYGGTIRGAIFLKQFIKKDTRWAHLDIAATASNLGHIPYYPKKGASGAYVRTLAQFVADF